MNKHRYYYIVVGSYGKKEEESIQILLFDTEQMTLSKQIGITGIENPSFLTVNRDGTHLYVLSEVEKGEIIVFQVDWEKREAIESSRCDTNGAHPCHIQLSEDERMLLSANYGGSSIGIYSLSGNGEIALCGGDVYEKDGAIVSKPHMVKAVRSEGSAYAVTDLGKDKLYLYQRVEGKLENRVTIPVPTGAGPRHIEINEEKNMMYVIHEFQSSISAYRFNNAVTSLEKIQEVSTLPEGYGGESFGAHLQLSSNADYLYASNRGHDSIVRFQVDDSGLLKEPSFTPTYGRWPRHFAVLENNEFALIANEHSNDITVLRLNENGQLLEKVELRYTIKNPTCIYVQHV
ncbi:lactonase family protein [Evansella cellulosilytica]|uniref:6-phosphogluconolactonase n=1 Tax=Evansella cellulosilytica (strain ATCC 21833 / DSM 2522 / FERM P-1141 / JCM 9156 / N-4) TaxID=649639 RepID=E6TT34_EVAC2|nr:lactonase family protein [Evansella cellulosilytica]ADU31942.1 hypothetical protein Bcell_3702 [Evansella cellulosilytica DSM 2522]